MLVTETSKRLAMWSGPRNLSTALMYAFAQRDDCAVWDEPFYAAYLHATGLTHPVGADILAAGETNPDHVIASCVGDTPKKKSLFYQKHMTQHMIPGFSRDWVLQQTNVFLIRHPARVLASYAVKRENPTLDDIGFRQQSQLIDLVIAKTGNTPLIIDSADIRDNPEAMLRTICDHIGVMFEPKMLTWPKGGIPEDGVWAPHWYGSVWQSTGFAGREGPLPAVPTHLQDVYADAKSIYDRMVALKTTG